MTRLPLVTCNDTSLRAVLVAFCDGKTVTLSKAMATFGSFLSEVKGEFLPTRQSLIGSDTMYSRIRWKHPVAAAGCGKTARSLSAGVVTSVIILRAVKAFTVVRESSALICACTAYTRKVMTGDHILGRLAC